MSVSASPEVLPGALAPSSVERGAGGRSNFLLTLLIVFLILEYARPPGIVQLKLQMIISLVLPILCLVQIKDRRWSSTLSYQLGLIAVTATGVLYASNYFAAYFVTRILFTTIAISICMAWLLARMDFFRRAMWAWTLIMAYVGIFGILVGGYGPGGIIGDENELALACNTAVPMAYFGAIASKGIRRFVYLGIGVILLSAVVLSNSRGGFVGLVLTVAYLILISKHRIRALLGISIAGLIFYASVPQSYINEIVSIEKEATNEVDAGTGDTRLFLWTAAFNMWKSHPILGVGAGNSRFLTGQYQPTDWENPIYAERDWSGTAIHSGVFELLSETGSLGVFFYVAMLVNHFAILRGVRRVARKARGLPDAMRSEMEMYAGALGGGVIGYVGSGLFLSVAYHPYAFYFSALSLALSWSLDLELRKRSARAHGGPSAPPPPDAPGTSGSPGASRPASPSTPPPASSLGSGLLVRRS